MSAELELRRLALQITLQLPEDVADARMVLQISNGLLGFFYDQSVSSMRLCDLVRYVELERCVPLECGGRRT